MEHLTIIISEDGRELHFSKNIIYNKAKFFRYKLYF